MNQKVHEMIRKGAVCTVNSHPQQFLSQLFLVDKMDGRKRPIVNLKMEGLHLLKDLCWAKIQNKVRFRVKKLSWKVKIQEINLFSKSVIYHNQKPASFTVSRNRNIREMFAASKNFNFLRWKNFRFLLIKISKGMFIQ